MANVYKCILKKIKEDEKEEKIGRKKREKEKKNMSLIFKSKDKYRKKI